MSSFHLLVQQPVSDNHELLSIGSKVQAVWSEDGEWYVEIERHC